MNKRHPSQKVSLDYEKSRVAVLLKRLIEFLAILMPLVLKVGEHWKWW